MKKHHFLTILLVFGGAGSALAAMYADADSFGGTNSSGNPYGIHLLADQFVTASFDFVDPDGTASFTIGTPYDQLLQGTYSSQLGYVPGTPIDPASLFFTFFFRDPNGGQESVGINIGPGDLIFRNGSFQGTLVTNFGANAALIGNIQADGSVNYRIKATNGEFVFDGAYAHFATPDGGSAVMLLGLALTVVGLLRRKLAN